MNPADQDASSRRYFAFIRAINTGGRRLTNDQLMEPFRRLGFTDVAAYQAAGNLTFLSDDPDAVAAERLTTAATEAYGFDSPVFVRSRAELGEVAGARPFSDDALADTQGRIQVSFMQTPPDEAAVAEVMALVPARDRVVFSSREWFWLPSRGVSDSRLPVAAIERLVGPMTMRTLGTISRMLGRFD